MSEHPFQKLTRFHKSRSEQFATFQYEEGRVKYLLKALRLPKGVIRDLREFEEHNNGDSYLTFRSFNAIFPSFPLLLKADVLNGVKLHLGPRAFLPALFNNFSAAPFVEPFEEFFEKAQTKANGRAIGLVFPRKGIQQGWLMTNDALAALPYSGGTFIYTGISERKQYHVYVRPFQSVLAAIYNNGHGWRPD